MSLEDPWQIVPLQDRYRTLTPPPHDTLQAVHMDQGVQVEILSISEGMSCDGFSANGRGLGMSDKELIQFHED
jgi:hypothetical protein